MARKLLGKKRGMVSVFDADGRPVPCTVISVEPNVVTQLKTVAVDGYDAIQVATGEIRLKDPRTALKRVTRPLAGHFAQAGVAPRKHVRECRVPNVSDYQLGQSLTVGLFEGVAKVDVTGISKGKGYQGVMKKYGFSGGPAAHGSGFHRHAGSTGMRTSPGRCLPGGPRASHMGNVQVTARNLRVVLADAARGILLVEGAVPGGKNGLVIVSEVK